MIRFSTLLKRATAAIMLGSLLVLAGCHRGLTMEQLNATAAKDHFDVTVRAYKDGQFLIDGAVLSAIDAGSHFAYLRDQGRLPKKVLLLPSDDSAVRKQHLQYMARMVLDYGFKAYFFDHKGLLTEINPVDIKARKLEDYHKRAPAAAPPVQDHSNGGGLGG